MDWDSEIERIRQQKQPSAASLFWSAFVDGPMGGMFAPLRLPSEPDRIFRPYSAVFDDLVIMEDQALRKALALLRDIDLERLMSAIAAVRAAHNGGDQPRP